MQIPAAVYALAIVVVGFTCPLTPLEQHFRSLAGEAGYEGGFVDRYIEGVIYPGSLTRLAQAVAAVVMLAGYALIVLARSDASRSTELTSRAATVSAWSWVDASTMTRTRGSVPLGRTSTRPVRPSSASASATSLASRSVELGGASRSPARCAAPAAAGA